MGKNDSLTMEHNIMINNNNKCIYIYILSKSLQKPNWLLQIIGIVNAFAHLQHCMHGNHFFPLFAKFVHRFVRYLDGDWEYVCAHVMLSAATFNNHKFYIRIGKNFIFVE